MRIPIVGLIALMFAPGLSAQSTSSVSVTGFLTDTLCGKRGATAQHIEHAKRSVASGKAQYAIYDERTRQLYILEGSQVSGSGFQGNIEQYLGQRVTITGTLSATPVKRAGEKLDSRTQEVVRHTPRAGTALDTSTPVAGVLAISSIQTATRN